MGSCQKRIHRRSETQLAYDEKGWYFDAESNVGL